MKLILIGLLIVGQNIIATGWTLRYQWSDRVIYQKNLESAEIINRGDSRWEVQLFDDKGNWQSSTRFSSDSPGIAVSWIQDYKPGFPDVTTELEAYL